MPPLRAAGLLRRAAGRPGFPSDPVPGPTAKAGAVTGPVMTGPSSGAGAGQAAAVPAGAVQTAEPPVAAATYRHVQPRPAPARPAPPAGRAGSRIGAAFVGDHPGGHVDDHPAAVQSGDRTRDHQVNLAAAAAAPPEHLMADAVSSGVVSM